LAEISAAIVAMFTNLYTLVAIPLTEFILNVTTTFDNFRINVVQALTGPLMESASPFRTSLDGLANLQKRSSGLFSRRS